MKWNDPKDIMPEEKKCVLCIVGFKYILFESDKDYWTYALLCWNGNSWEYFGYGGDNSLLNDVYKVMYWSDSFEPPDAVKDK